MIPLSLREVADAVGGTLAPPGADGTVTGAVTVDSRTVESGGLFVAIAGTRTDGHEHAASAVQAGAVAALTERPLPDVPCVVVDDTVTALGRLAAAVRRRLPAAVVGVTGSSGKTSTKDLLAHVLARLGSTVAPPGSFNNDIGMPLTVLSADAQTRCLVLEMGARGAGHIRRLADVARPQIGVVLNVGSAHVGEFGSREAIATAKAELAEAATDLAVLNADDPLVLRMRERVTVPVMTFGEDARADVRAEQVELGDDGRARFTLVARGEKAPVRLALVGEHHVSNALAAAAVAVHLGLPVAEVADALGSARAASRWRMEVVERPDGVTVINDAYNANPESMRAALKALAVLSRGKTRRTWAVLGQMAELGEATSQEHMDLGRFVVRLDVSRLVVVGPEAGGIHAGAVLEGSWGDESVHVDDPEQALALLRAELAAGDVVLVKASRAAGLERLAAALLEEDS